MNFLLPTLSSIVLVSLLSFGCGSQPSPVVFSTDWPTEIKSYEESTEDWTRRGLLRASMGNQASQLLELHATFLSTQWRASYVDRQAELQKLSPSARAEMNAEQKKIASAHHQVKLIVSTYHPEHNELHRDQSMWRIVLVDEQGNQYPAEKIEKDRRPKQLISAEFNNLGDFGEAYLATFAPTPELLSGKKFSLRISCSIGTVDVDWQSK